MRSSLPSSFAKLLICCLTILATSSAFAGVNGALYTTNPSGTQVNGNIYMSKSDVYINGGPQNKKDNGLVPAPGYYYFQVTDPSGSVLLSKDAVTCRVVYVNLNSGGNGVIDGVPGNDGSDPTANGFGNSSCYHNMGPANPANGSQPVQLCNPTSSLCPTDFADTPNPGGEYKAWITPVDEYVGPSGTCQTGANHFGFCDSQSKTDNFKIKAPGTVALTACKFIDTDGDHTFDPNTGDFMFAGWPITATDTATNLNATQSTDKDGCTTFEFILPKSSSDTVTLTEGANANYTQVAPLDCSTLVSNDAGVSCSVTNGVVTLTNIVQDDVVTAPLFGNAPNQTTLVPMTMSKTAAGGNNFSWNVSKSVEKTEIDDSSGTATFNYTVAVGHDAGTGWVVGGVISFINPDPNTPQDVTTLTDATDVAGTCLVPDFVNPTTVPSGGGQADLNYTCTFTTNPGPGTNTATADPSILPATASFDFSSADTSASITDSIAVSLGTVTINADNSTSCPVSAPAGFVGSNWACTVKDSTATFTYSETFDKDPAGTCTIHDNTATFTTNTNTTGNSDDVTVKQCVGKDLTVSKAASAAFDSSISKSVDKTKVEQSGGNITFNYTVTVSESNWKVTGTITVTNPNDWESITFNVSDLLSDSGGSCSVTGGSSVTLKAGASTGPLSYSCTFAARPTAVSGTNTGSATVTSGIVPDSTVSSSAIGYTFATLTITDNIHSSANPNGCNATLGTVTVTTTTASGTPGCGLSGLNSPSWGVFKYGITDTNSNPGTCTSYDNNAQITGGGSSGTVTVTVCNTNTGALTMGFWKNTNGQKIINAQAKTGICPSGTWLRLLDPFQDLSATATCSQVASYVNTTLSAATCGGSTCNPMLKAQMLATALDVYFSTVGLGGNQIGAYNGLGTKTPAIGGVAIDLSHICGMVDGSSGSSCSGSFEDIRPEFGIANTCTGATVNTMLSYSNYVSGVNGSPNGSTVSNSGGSKWYNQVKTPKQVYAKDGFDSVNNTVANIAPSGVCISTF